MNVDVGVLVISGLMVLTLLILMACSQRCTGKRGRTRRWSCMDFAAPASSRAMARSYFR